MSHTTVPMGVKLLLWGEGAGRCYYCNGRLGRDPLTKAEHNFAYVAHIIADDKNGPRGDAVLSEKLKADISNLMLLCDVHHRLVDVHDVAGHPVELLQKMKAEHEERVDLAASLQIDKRTTILAYGANIGEQTSPLTAERVKQAVFPERYPASSLIQLGVTGSEARDRTTEFWAAETENLRKQFNKRVRPHLEEKSMGHLSIFGLAPQPLLMLFGSLLTDIPEADVFQLKREPTPTWRWPDSSPASQTFELLRPTFGAKGTPALVLSLSATVKPERISSILGDDARIWVITIPSPGQDVVQSREQLSLFRAAMRAAYNDVKAAVGEGVLLHVFPVAPVSACIEVGRVRQPKADLPLVVYDSIDGVFTRALEIR